MRCKETIAVQYGLLRLAKLLGGTSTEVEVRSAMNNVMLDIGGATLEERQRAEEPSAAPGFTGHLTGTPALAFETSDGASHVVSIDYTLRLLKRLYDEWPGGLEEIESAMRTSAERLEHINRLQADLSRLAPGSMGWADFYGTPQPDNIVLPPQARIPRCPVTPGTHIRVRFRDGEELDTREPELMRWGWTRPYLSAADIVAWRFVERDSIV